MKKNQIKSQAPINCAVVGASGYAGAQLVTLIHQHPLLRLSALAVSAASEQHQQSFRQLYPNYAGQCPTSGADNFLSYDELRASQQWSSIELVFLATPHEWSAESVPELLAENKRVIDLSGAFRLQNAAQFKTFYQFNHPAHEYMRQMAYGLPELQRAELIDASGVAVAGCYASAATLSLAPLAQQEWLSGPAIINAVSGVSGAGRKATAANAFCEVSLAAYAIGAHRHQPEIEQALQHPVIFTPHLGAFTRGILATTVVPLQRSLTQTQLDEMYHSFYATADLVNIVSQPPAIAHVTHTPFMHLFAKVIRDGRFVEIVAVIDNLMKGAASGAIQCVNACYQWPDSLGLVNCFGSIDQLGAA